ncbi:hypothetical protein GUITHDRAFT_162349 [Guillardia theta CCMP2712]|uniref:Uncharacterized protein n=2 Tax=Guillardia theta TaxID=55529 RepID=L1JKS2_GUITC|nr:hypothetical protein GUITHDRAFT_162349 [Guillardia theta CCMP2712]EKX48917.1 hypothetical protein GUITHDRAFT_162349 [Guillardia theta CCMP2712]|eukprot:XP_005835897.1 hypothetical protein GUITHDRAFT_162349 [Guillardia theta CCMP2712]
MIGPDGMKELTKIFPRLCQLEVLDLRGNPIRDKGAKTLALGLQKHTMLHRVGVSLPTDLGSSGWRRLADLVGSTSTRMEIPQANKLAALMGLQKRLGQSSWLHVLDTSIMQLILLATATDRPRSFMDEEERVCVFIPPDDSEEHSSMYGTCDLAGL